MSLRALEKIKFGPDKEVRYMAKIAKGAIRQGMEDRRKPKDPSVLKIVRSVVFCYRHSSSLFVHLLPASLA